jgi:hypothetical protein
MVETHSLLVVILSSGSLLLEGVATRLRGHSSRVELALIDPRSPDLLMHLTQLSPAAVILDAADPWVAENCPMTRLLSAVPGARIIELDTQTQQIRVVSSEQYPASDVNALVDVIDGHLPT